MAEKKTGLESYIGGLSLMIIFTTVWTISGEYYFNNLDFYIAGIIFGSLVLYLILYYIRFVKINKDLLTITTESNPKKDKWFYTIFALEGVAIFLARNILLNIGRDDLFISSIAFIVGVHFIPLAKIFDRKFDFYMGCWTTIIACIGFTLIWFGQFNFKLVNGFVCAGCALSTSSYGLKIVMDGKNYLDKQKHEN